MNNKRAIHYKLCVLILACWAMFSHSAVAEETLAPVIYDLSQFTSGASLDPKLHYFEDQHNKLSLADMLTQAWQPIESKHVSFGYTNSTYWLRIGIRNNQDINQRRLLSISYPVLDKITIYSRINAGEWQSLTLGDKQPFYERILKHRYFILPVEFNANSSIEYLFKIKTSGSMQFPLSIWHEHDFFIQDQTQVLALGVYYGLMGVMAIYNLFIFIAVRERSYLYYVLHVACIAGFMASLQGINFQYIWPNATEWNDKSTLTLLGGTSLFGALFVKHFLHLYEFKKLALLINTIIVGVFVAIVMGVFYPYHLMIQVMVVVVIIYQTTAISVGLIRWYQGFKPALYYSVAWSPFLLGGLLLAFSHLGMLPSNFLTNNVFQIGSALEVLLLSFALADRLNQEKMKRSLAQEAALEKEVLARQLQEETLRHERAARQAQNRALELQKQSTETLERRVKERTQELEQLNQKLGLMSITDPLTKLYNRRYFDQNLPREMDRAIRQREPLCMAMVDIDYFKKVNDTYGHQVGDQVLQAVAEAMCATVKRGTDLVVRFGGEEFILVLPNTTLEQGMALAEEVRLRTAALDLEVIHQGLSITISIGVYSKIPKLNEHYEQWVRCADDALYQAKAAGRNQVVAYTNASAESLK